MFIYTNPWKETKQNQRHNTEAKLLVMLKILRQIGHVLLL